MRIGIAINRDGGRNYVKIESNDYELVESALEEELGINCTGWATFNVDERFELKKGLQEFFDTHSQFYDYFGFDAGVEHGPTGQDFNTGGWRTFLSDNFGVRYASRIEDEEALQLFANVIAERLKEALDEYEDELINEDEDFVAKSSVTVEAEPEGMLTDPEMMEDAVVLTNDGAKKIQIHDVKGAETLEEVHDKVQKDTKGVYEKQVEARVKMLRKKNQRLEDKLESERKEMLVKGIEMLGGLDNWKVENNYLKYTEPVHLETVKRKNQDEPRELTEEAKEKFYIEGVKIPIKKDIKTIRYDDGYHPHALSHGTCTGGFSAEMGEEGLKDAVNQLKQADLHNSSYTEAETDLKENWEEYIKTEENEDGEEEEVTQEVWDAEN